MEIVLDKIIVPGVMTAKLWIKEGSRADSNSQKGAHHLLGSLLTRGSGPYDHHEVADLVETCGAALRCETNEDGHLVTLKCADSDAQKLLPLLGWMVTDPHLDNEQIKLEKELTLQALHRQKENPFHLAFDGWRNLAYKNGPYGHDPLGVKKDLLCINQKELLPLAKKLVINSSALAIAGTCPESLIKNLFNDIPFKEFIPSKNNVPSKQIEIPKLAMTNSGSHGSVSVHPQSTNQVVILLGQPTIPHGHDDDLALRLLNCHLGVGMSSLLFRNLREEHGVTYDVGVHHPIRERNGPFLIHASTSEEKAKLSLQLLNESWLSLSDKQITDQELELAKAKFKGLLAHGSQTSGQRAERKAQLKSFDLSDDFDKLSLERLEFLTKDDLVKVARKHLSNPLLSLCGPEKITKHLSEIWLN